MKNNQHIVKNDNLPRKGSYVSEDERRDYLMSFLSSNSHSAGASNGTQSVITAATTLPPSATSKKPTLQENLVFPKNTAFGSLQKKQAVEEVPKTVAPKKYRLMSHAIFFFREHFKSQKPSTTASPVRGGCAVELVSVFVFINALLLLLLVNVCFIIIILLSFLQNW